MSCIQIARIATRSVCSSSPSTSRTGNTTHLCTLYSTRIWLNWHNSNDKSHPRGLLHATRPSTLHFNFLIDLQPRRHRQRRVLLSRCSQSFISTVPTRRSAKTLCQQTRTDLQPRNFAISHGSVRAVWTRQLLPLHAAARPLPSTRI